MKNQIFRLALTVTPPKLFGSTYYVHWMYVDKAGNYAQQGLYMPVTILGAHDAIVPQVVERTVLERSGTTAKVKIDTDEIIKKLAVQYRIPGTTEWTEIVFDNIDVNSFEANLTGLQAGVDYEYRLVLEDLVGNILITDIQDLLEPVL